MRLGTQGKNVCDRALASWVMFTLLVAGSLTHSRWQRSTSQRNIPALSGMGDGLWNVKGERHPTRFWVQLTDPRERDPQASVPKATCSKLSLSVPRGPYLPLLFLVKEQFWSCFLGWHYSSVCPAFSLPGEPSASLTLFYSFIILASEEGRFACPFYRQKCQCPKVDGPRIIRVKAER